MVVVVVVVVAAMRPIKKSPNDKLVVRNMKASAISSKPY